VFPLGHLAVGYLCYVGYRVGVRREPSRAPLPALVVLAVATQLPDLIDKPLAYLGVLASGRSLAHSLPFVALVVALVWLANRRLERPWLPGAVAVGLCSHLAADSYRSILAGRWSDLRFLAYPLTDPLVSPVREVSPITRIVRYYSTRVAGTEVALVALAAIVLAWRLWRSRRRPRRTVSRP
jgi:membrane-bound metal-dependent hydrolase YbcI (DUF457 family)